MPKSAKFISVYRTNWRSIKAQVDPKALKECDFSKGLGPALDKLEKLIDPMYEEEEVSAKSLKSLTSSVEGIQKIIKSYRDDVIKGNQKYPDLGPSWANLHQSLKHLDEQMTDEAKEMGANVSKLSGWLNKSEFQRPEVQSTRIENVDYSESVGTLLRKLDGKKGDPAELLKALSHKSVGGCFVYSPKVAEELIKQADVIARAYKFIQGKLGETNPNHELIGRTLEELNRRLAQMTGGLGGAGRPLQEFLEQYVVEPLTNQINQSTQNPN